MGYKNYTCLFITPFYISTKYTLFEVCAKYILYNETIKWKALFHSSTWRWRVKAWLQKAGLLAEIYWITFPFLNYCVVGNDWTQNTHLSLSMWMHETDKQRKLTLQLKKFVYTWSCFSYSFQEAVKIYLFLICDFFFVLHFLYVFLLANSSSS